MTTLLSEKTFKNS